jgi:flagellar M-ring protein FliF
MDQLRKLLAALDMRQRITILVAAALVVGGMFALTHWHTENDFKPLYTSLSPEDAAAVIQKLKESGTEYRVSESGTAVLAPSARVAELRLELAAAGLPKTGRIGYELFDKTNFGATEFTEHLNYHRALEGELERSISALSVVEQARVHLTFPKDSVFLDSRQPAKASVLLKLRPGSKLTPANVAAITNLVASAVEGLAPEAVSVLDMRGNLLNRPRRDENTEGQASEASLDYRQKIEADLLAKVNATLEPLLGAEKFRAGVSVDCDFTNGEQSEETLDPTKSVMVTSQKTEEQSGANLASGQPGTASALPRPTSKPGSGGSGLSRKTENISFQSSRVVRHVKLGQGAIKRMSVSVLVDHTVRMQGQGVKAKRVVSPPSPETLKAIRELVSAVTGFSAERGDQIVVEALPFESTVNFEPMAVEAPGQTTIDPRIPKWLTPYIKDFSTLLIAGGAILGLLLLAAGAVLLRMRKKAAKATTAAAIEAGAAGGAAGKGLSAEQVTSQLEAQQAERRAMENALQQQLEADAIGNMRIPVATTKKADVLIRALRESVAKDAEGTTNVLRTWLAEGAK